MLKIQAAANATVVCHQIYRGGSRTLYHYLQSHSRTLESRPNVEMVSKQDSKGLWSLVEILLIGPRAIVYRVRCRAAARLPVGADVDSHFGRKMVDRTSNKHPIILPKMAIFPKA